MPPLTPSVVHRGTLADVARRIAPADRRLAIFRRSLEARSRPAGAECEVHVEYKRPDDLVDTELTAERSGTMANVGRRSTEPGPMAGRNLSRHR
jgi:hypothetical protein